MAILKAFEKFAGEWFLVECGAHVGDGGGDTFAGEQVKTLGGGAAGFVWAEQIGVAARRGFGADKLAGLVERGLAGGEGETVVLGPRWWKMANTPWYSAWSM